MSIWHDKIKFDILSIGYEQMDSSSDNSVDAEDAIRIYFDRHPDPLISDEELKLLTILVEQDFYKEFKEKCDDTR